MSISREVVINLELEIACWACGNTIDWRDWKDWQTWKSTIQIAPCTRCIEDAVKAAKNET